MELDFDKEIDTLLRKAQRDAPVLVGDVVAPGHLDADEISAFAENAMPEKTRDLYLAHLGDCDRCRKILADVLVMNSEAIATAAPAAAITIAERNIPWYRRLLLFPNLAYVMGGLVLVFAGFLGYTIVQDPSGDSSLVSQVSETESTEHGPSFNSEPSYSANTMANSVANTSTSTFGSTAMTANSNAASARAIPGSSPLAEVARRSDNKFALDGVSSADSAVAAPPPSMTQPAMKDAPKKEREELAKKAEEEGAGVAAVEADKSAGSNLTLRRQESLPNVSAQSGPSRNNENQYNRQLENMDARAKRAMKDDRDSSSGRKVISGKTFERKDGVWYDTTYQGRPTVNVRRGTAEFNKLDAGLRSIANSLTGTAVIVWEAKAYRIQ